MTMKVVVEIGDNYIELISKWASVSRTLNESKRLVGTLLDHAKDSPAPPDIEPVNSNLDELTDIEPFLNHIHQQVRTAIWEIKRRKRLELPEVTPEEQIVFLQEELAKTQKALEQAKEESNKLWHELHPEEMGR
jgi:seryl-tRNA synthetase